MPMRFVVALLLQRVVASPLKAGEVGYLLRGWRASVLRLTLRWTAEDAASHLCQPGAVNVSRDYKHRASLRTSPMSRDARVALDRLRCLVAFAAIRRRVKRRLAMLVGN